MYTDVALEPIIDSIQYVEMSDEEYFSEKWADYISNSRLKAVNPAQGGSFELFEKGLPQAYSDSLILGSAVHELILQPDDFKLVETVDRPTAKAGYMADELYPLCNDEGEVNFQAIVDASDKIGYYRGKLNETIAKSLMTNIKPYLIRRRDFESYYNGVKIPIYVDAKTRDKVKACVASLKANKEITDLLHPEGLIKDPISMNEAALLMEVKASYMDVEIILPLKCKLDNFTFDVETGELVLNDLKTSGHLLNDFAGSFDRFHYSRQMGMYLYILRRWCEKEYKVIPTAMHANMLVCSTIPDFRSGVYKVNNDQIKQGFAEFKELLQRVAYGRICRVLEAYS